MNEFDRTSRQDRAVAQDVYGIVMKRMFCGFIALHRLNRIIARAGGDDYAQERAAKAQAHKKKMTEMLGGALKELGPEDVARCKAFSAALVNHDLSSGDDVVIEDVLRKLKG